MFPRETAMADDYLPRTDADAAAWMGRFARTLSERREAYRVAGGVVAEVAIRADAFAEALRLSTQQETRGPMRTARKSEARAAAEAVCRPVAQQVKTDPNVSDDDKRMLGIRPPNRRRRRASLADDAVPLLWVPPGGDGAARVHQIAFANRATPSRAAKPAAAAGLQLYRHVGELLGPPTGPDFDGPMEFVGVFSRSPARAPYAASERGRVITYAARWVTRRGEVGERSQAVSALATVGGVEQPRLPPA